MKEDTFDSQEMQASAAENHAESQVHAPADTAQGEEQHGKEEA